MKRTSEPHHLQWPDSTYLHPASSAHHGRDRGTEQQRAKGNPHWHRVSPIKRPRFRRSANRSRCDAIEHTPKHWQGPPHVTAGSFEVTQPRMYRVGAPVQEATLGFSSAQCMARPQRHSASIRFPETRHQDPGRPTRAEQSFTTVVMK